MALTYTPTAALGSACPDFSLPTVEKKTASLKDFSKSKVLVVMFICNHCPYVQAIEDRLIQLGDEYNRDDVGFVAICSNDPSEYPEDAPAKLFERWKEKAYPFPYLVDESQKVAHAFGAVCTPDLYVYDKDRKLRYRGRLDDSWRNAFAVTRQEMKLAIDSLLAHQLPHAEQIPSMGCSIKWKDK